MIARVDAGRRVRAGEREVAAAGAWQRALREAVSSVGELLELLRLDAAQLAPELRPATEAARDFPLRVPRGFVARMREGDPSDPLLLQVLPTAAELVAAPGYTADPLAETSDDLGPISSAEAGAAAGEGSPVSPAPGILHKYRGRALLLLTGACAI